MDVSESDKKLWQLIRQHGLEAGRLEWEAWRQEKVREEEERFARPDPRSFRLSP